MAAPLPGYGDDTPGININAYLVARHEVALVLPVADIHKQGIAGAERNLITDGFA